MVQTLVYRPEQVHESRLAAAHGRLTTEQAVAQLLLALRSNFSAIPAAPC